MHEKVKHLFPQKTQRQEDIRQDKLLLPLSRYLLLSRYLQATLSRTLTVTFNFLFILFDCNFYYFL